eukprot:917883-Amphidinium_carterae.1
MEIPHTTKPNSGFGSDRKVYMAHYRRGLALHVVGTLTFPVHTQLVDKLFLIYLTDLQVGPGRMKLEQTDQNAFEQPMCFQLVPNCNNVAYHKHLRLRVACHAVATSS